MATTTLERIQNTESTEKEKSTFQILWNKIEKCEVRNKKAIIKVDELYDNYQSTVLPHEKILGKTHCDLVKHLLSYVPSNRLKKKDRFNLLSHIDQNFEKMDNIPFLYDLEIVEQLKKESEKYWGKYFAKERKKELDNHYDDLKDILNDAFGEDIEVPDEELKDAILSGDFNKIESILNEIKEAQFENKQHSNHYDEDEWEDFEFNYYKHEDDESSKITEIFKASQLNKMYKKIANIIHPDKELDPNKQKEKHKQMQLLVTAKNERDVFTLIKMYQEFVPDNDYTLDESTIIHIEHLLQMRIQKLNQEHRNIFNSQGFKSYVWKTYSATSKKKSVYKMEKHVNTIEYDIVRMKNHITHLNSVNEIKKLISRQLNRVAMF